MQAKINMAEGKTEMPGMESTYLKRQDKSITVRLK